jgi:hypothetical protein
MKNPIDYKPVVKFKDQDKVVRALKRLKESFPMMDLVSLKEIRKDIETNAVHKNVTVLDVSATIIICDIFQFNLTKIKWEENKWGTNKLKLKYDLYKMTIPEREEHYSDMLASLTTER